MEFKKNIKDIYSVEFNDGKLIETLVRVDPFHFSGCWNSTDGSEVCPCCGDFINGRPDKHKDCELRIFTEQDLIDEVEFMTNSVYGVVICINKYLEDEVYLKLENQDKSSDS